MNACGQHSLPPPDEIELREPVSVPLEFVGGFPIVSVRLNGRGPFKFILDTGATGSVVAEGLAREIRLPAISQVMMGRPGSDKPATATITRVAKIEICDGLALKGVTAVFADLSAVQKKAPDVQGVLSAAMFQGLLVAFNYPTKTIEFRRGELPAEDGQTLFAWAAAEGLPSFTADVGGQSVRMHLDTGSSSGFILNTTIASKLTWLQAPSEGMPIRTLDMETNSFAGQMKGIIRIGKFVFENPRLKYAEGFNNMGYEVLKDFVVTLDPKNRRFELSRD
jgi:predicted aspartyl protease